MKNDNRKPARKATPKTAATRKPIAPTTPLPAPVSWTDAIQKPSDEILNEAVARMVEVLQQMVPGLKKAEAIEYCRAEVTSKVNSNRLTLHYLSSPSGQLIEELRLRAFEKNADKHVDTMEALFQRT
jgi:hypothetical protein